MTARSIKGGREVLDNVAHTIRDLAKNKHDPVTPYGGAPLGEDYIRGDLRVHVHLGGDRYEWCAVFQHMDPSIVPDGLGHMVVPYRNEATPGDTGRPGSNYENQPMLVGKVDLIQVVEGMVSWTSTGAVIRLQPLDRCLMYRVETLYHVKPTLAELGYKTLFRWRASFFRVPNQMDRKLSVPWGCRCTLESELPNQTIEGRPEIVSHLTDTDAPVLRWEDIEDDVIRILSPLRIRIGLYEPIVGHLAKGVLHSAEMLDLAHCTPYLEARAVKRMHEVVSRYGIRTEAEDPEGLRDADPQAEGLRRGHSQAGESEAQALNAERPRSSS